MGKSRLVFELTHSYRVEGWLVLEAGSVSYGKATSYLPVIELLKGYCRIGDQDTYREIREKVTGKLLTLDRALEPTLPALLALLDVPVEDPQWQALDPPQRRQRTLDAIKRLLLREAQTQPLLVIFEDLHWIDSETTRCSTAWWTVSPPSACCSWSAIGRSTATPGGARPSTPSSAWTRWLRRVPGSSSTPFWVRMPRWRR